MTNFFSQINVRTYYLSVIGLCTILITLLFVYAVIPQYKSYNNLNIELTKLQRFVDHNSKFSTNIDQLLQDIEIIQRQVKGDTVDLPEKEMEAYILGVLQNISWSNNINLIGVKPSKGGEINKFEEVLFRVKLSGDYFNLYQWFLELRKDLGFIVIKKLNLSPSKDGDNVMPLLMDLTIASYKSIKE